VVSDGMRLQVSDGLDMILLSPDEVLIQFGVRSGPSELIRDPESTGAIAHVVTRLAGGPTSPAELVSGLSGSCQQVARQVIELLATKAYLAEEGTNPTEQYLRYSQSHTSSLSAHHVAVIGCGPIGSRVAVALLESGVGMVTAVDDRMPDRHWQGTFPSAPQFGDGALSHRPVSEIFSSGLPADHSRRVRPVVGLFDSDVLRDATAEADFVVLALECPSLTLSHRLNRICVDRQLPWMSLTLDGNVGMAGPIFVPPTTACFNCFTALSQAPVANREMTQKYRRYQDSKKASSFFVGLPSYADILAGHGGHAAVRFLIGRSGPLVGRALLLDFDRLGMDLEDVLRLPRCPACGVLDAGHRSAFPAEVVAQIVAGSETLTAAKEP
jgi:bacteriocin biosynthesis cyclodehydratase domain-containing protein